jgi:4a-hydroxytetrahydrobiopterin dehydratase
MPELLTKAEIDSRLREVNGWRSDGQFITQRFEFENFKEAIQFVNRVAEVAERQEHHPDVHLRYNEVTLSIQTHSKGGVTEWDFDLAKEIDGVRS